MTGAAVPPGFTLGRLLGRGNSAAVYLARDEAGRKVALKLPLPQTLADPECAERFANEVRLSLQLRHERLVGGLAGVGFGPGSFLAMRYFPEGTLARWLDLGKLSAPEALRLLADVGSALAFLHARGVVHQDVKSHNVYLEAGRAALGDFGAAYFASQGGKAAGSPFYMAPEIYRGEGGSPASDVYSLGVLAYELLAHERPFQGQSYEELMAAHLGRYPKPLTTLAPEVPRGLCQHIERALAKQASERPDAAALARLFERALGAEPTSEETPPDVAAKSIQLGRDGARGPVAAPKPAAPPGPERSRSWNPFKRRPGR